MRNNFDAIRLAMALLVVWSHCFPIRLGTDQNEWMNRLMGGLYTSGAIAVMVFFTISGFLVSQSYERSKSKLSYLAKRARRIYPGYLMATTICAFIVVPLFSTHADLSLVRVVKVAFHNLLLSGYFPPSDAFATNPDHEVNVSLWTIPYEFACYLGILVVGAKRGSSLIVILASVLLAHVAAHLLLGEPPSGFVRILYVWTDVLPSFLVGMLAYVYRARLPRSRTMLIGSLAAAIISCRLNGHIAYLIVAPALAYATFYVAFSDRIRLHHFGANGDFSYGTYLYAYPIQQILQAKFGGSLGFPSFVAISLALSLAAGVLSWHLVEKHFLLSRRLTRADKTSATPATLDVRSASSSYR